MADVPPFDVLTETAERNVDRLGIKYDELPHLPFWSPLVGKFEQDFRVKIAALVMAGSTSAGRGLSQPETDAIAESHASVLVMRVWCTPITMGTTAAFYRRTYAQYGFPFWTPKPEKFNPTRFLGLSPSPYAPKLWHGLRMLTWYACCKAGVNFVLISYLVSRMRRLARDPRLSDYHKDVIQVRETRRTPPQLQRLPPSEAPSDAWPNTEQTAAQNTQDDTQDTKPSWFPMQNPRQGAEQDPFEADATPVAPAEQQQGAVQQSTTGGSAWDRLRRKQLDSTQQTSAWGRKHQDELTSRGAREGTSFTYSSEDEEKAYAKDQAQKDFDEMLEKERRGQASGRR